ncbi:hypothetical protein NUU61_000544 [Penicillium alfredii]|uniref:GDT1 family protein n=1 Tax=Penicillium alfredii TaxID=1506179 RepID=A0A9W9GB57_9EURO|nr:uncharacterized protein NUU61_000544 [Penicillium alfredii]KAJ5114785.1 hypothetical protein NUU61_000544 [Penicillium alfredii]
MKISQSSPFLLFLLPAIASAFTNTAPTAGLRSRESRDSSGTNSRPVDFNAVYNRGTPDVPVDGKDGRPHAGPWVETSAERDRKGRDDDKPNLVSTQYDSKIPSSQRQSTDDGKAIPHSNSGVMDDPYRAGPKEGTRGTEGGVSEKEKVNQFNSEKVPGGPKEVPPLPPSEKQKLSDNDGTSGGGARGSDGTGNLGVLEKPADLPESPHDNSRPKTPAQMNGDSLGSATLDSSTVPIRLFLVAALMAMRHARLVVFSAAFCALVAMTVLSAVLGHAVPTLIPKSFTKFMAAVLFLIFGVKMLKEGREMSPDEGVGEEMAEVEQELEEKEHHQRRIDRRRSSVTPQSLEAGRAGGRPKSRGATNRMPSPPESVSSSSSRGSSPRPSRFWDDFVAGINNLFSLLLSPAWVQTFAMTFLGEWGDRSQIATIAMAAGQDYWWVTIGAITGHGICTAVAVIGGRAIAGRVSMRVVTLGGAAAFLVFGVIYLLEAIY